MQPSCECYFATLRSVLTSSHLQQGVVDEDFELVNLVVEEIGDSCYRHHLEPIKDELEHLSLLSFPMNESCCGGSFEDATWRP